MTSESVSPPPATSLVVATAPRGHASDAGLPASSPIVLLAIVVVGLAAFFAVIGADARWLAALGGIIWSHHAILAGIPFASSPTGHWPNTIVLAELIFHGLESGLGDRGLMLAQLFAVAVAVAVLARDAIARGATAQSATTAILLVAVGALPDLAVTRLQLFSIALFPLAVALLRNEARAPSHRIWLIVPLLAVWSNLHGAALIGLGMTLTYLVLLRFRQDPGTAVAIAIAALLAICATPSGIHTIAYYHGVLTNEAARRGQGLWAPLSLTSPLDILLILAAVPLVARLTRSRPKLWELVVLAMLAALNVKTSRSGVWFLFFLAPMVAQEFRPRELWSRLLPALGTVALLVLVFAIARGPLPTGASSRLVARAIALSHGTPVLAEDSIAEQVALAGGRVWISNPIDAFSRRDQDAYLDWLSGGQGGLRAVTPKITVVLTQRRSPAERLMARDRQFKRVSTDRLADLYVRTS